MPCYHPIPARQDRPGAEIRLHPHLGEANLQLPCGGCLGCRTSLALQWARRAQQEASLWDHNCFVTLTYDDKHLPDNGHLRPKHLTDFIKRLRRRLDRPAPAIAWNPNSKPRYLASGEYGETTLRPHYHILLFNAAFTDGRRVGKDLWESPELLDLWKLGTHRIGALTGASANYVAQYSLKKLVTPEGRHDNNGEVYKDPFIRMSKKPPLGNGWLLKYKNDLRHGYLVSNDARKEKIPRALMKQLAKIDPELAEQASYNASKAPRRIENLSAAEEIHASKNNLFHSRPL